MKKHDSRKFAAITPTRLYSSLRGFAYFLIGQINSHLSQEKHTPPTLVPSEYVALLLRLASQVIGIPGDILEVGVYKGGTLYRIAQHINRYHRRTFGQKFLIGIDTFEGHPYTNRSKDPSHHYKGRFADTSYEYVSENLRKFPFVKVFKGECSQVFSTLQTDQRFNLAHLDVDIYESYERCIEYVYPRLSPGGIIVCDEYQGYGQKEFIDSYFKDKKATLELRTGLSGGNDYGVIIRKTD